MLQCILVLNIQVEELNKNSKIIPSTFINILEYKYLINVQKYVSNVRVCVCVRVSTTIGIY